MYMIGGVYGGLGWRVRLGGVGGWGWRVGFEGWGWRVGLEGGVGVELMTSYQFCPGVLTSPLCLCGAFEFCRSH